MRAVNTAEGQVHGVLRSVHDFGGGQLLQGGLVEMQILCIHLVCDIVFVVALHVPREEFSQQPKTLLSLRLARVKLRASPLPSSVLFVVNQRMNIR